MKRIVAAALLFVALDAVAQERPPGPGRGSGGAGPGGGPGQAPLRPGGNVQPPRRAMGNPMQRPRNIGQGGQQGGPQGGRQQMDPATERANFRINGGRGDARMGRCDEALRKLLPQIDSTAFTADAAVAAAICTERLGWLEDAIFLGRRATELDPYHIRAATLLALHLDAWGDRPNAEAELDRIEGVAPSLDPSLYGRAVLAIRDGDFDEFDILARRWPAEGKAGVELRRLQARTWLDLDDAISAFNAIAQQGKGESWEDITLRAEAARRVGDRELAMEVLGAERMEEQNLAAVDAIRARVLVDDRKLEEAKRVLTPYIGLPYEEVVASRWYLARASGAAEDAATLAHEFEALKDGHARRLEFMIPLAARPKDVVPPQPMAPVAKEEPAEEPEEPSPAPDQR